MIVKEISSRFPQESNCDPIDLIYLGQSDKAWSGFSFNLWTGSLVKFHLCLSFFLFKLSLFSWILVNCFDVSLYCFHFILRVITIYAEKCCILSSYNFLPVSQYFPIACGPHSQAKRVPMTSQVSWHVPPLRQGRLSQQPFWHSTKGTLAWKDREKKKGERNWFPFSNSFSFQAFNLKSKRGLFSSSSVFW